jgi:hypothetical protein
MIRRPAFSAVATLPETGASTIAPPAARTRSARPRENAGETVLMSTAVFPGPIPLSAPLAPS